MSNSITFEINSLNEYISFIKDNRLSNYYFRGENSKYNTISSSLLRKDTSLLLKKESFNFYEDIVNNYYDEIATHISEFDRKNFLAFSQHHGLLTNLIDFTTAPLVALYFACAKNNLLDVNNRGYVYLIEKERTIDVSRLINDCFSPPAINYNLIEMFRNREPKIIQAFVSYIDKYSWNNVFEKYRTDIINQCHNLSSSSIGAIQVFFNEYIQVINNPELLINPEFYYNLLFNDSRINLKEGQCSNNTGIYINLLWEFFNVLTSMSFFNKKGIDTYFPNIPYFIYKTPYKFDRIRNQEGLFIYQLYHTYAMQYEDVPDAIIKQEILSDITIMINDQISILDELDFIGINAKSIYGDFDNIATYINKRHF